MSDDAGPLRHRGTVLRDQHQLLLSLYGRFKSHGKRMQRICHCGEDRSLSGVETAEDVWRSNDDADAARSRLQPATDEVVLHKKRLRSGDDAHQSDPVSEAACVQSQVIPVASWSTCATSRHCADKNVSNSNVPSRDVAGTIRPSHSHRIEHDDQTPAREANDDGNHSESPHTTVASAVVGSTSSVPSSSTLTLCVSQPVPDFTQPATKKLRLPPPSPSLLSLSSGSPPMSPPLPPVWRPSYRPAAAAASTHKLSVTQPRCQQTTRMLPHHGLPAPTAVTGPPPNKALVPRAAGSTVSSFNTTSALGAGCRVTDEVAASQSSQTSVTKSVSKSRFSLRQLIEDDIIQPGHNVLSVRDPVMFCRLFDLAFLTSFTFLTGCLL